MKVEPVLLAIGFVLSVGEAVVEAAIFIMALWFVSLPIIVIPSVVAGASYGEQVGMITALTITLTVWLVVFLAALLKKILNPEDIEWAG